MQGSWAGKGTKKRKTNPKFLKTTPGLLEAERKDAKFSNVIISEKKDKKASQYQVKDLPYPYTSVQQYEKRFDNPLGSEWNSRAGHQRGTLPRVTKKVSWRRSGVGREGWTLMCRRALSSSRYDGSSRAFLGLLDGESDGRDRIGEDGWAGWDLYCICIYTVMARMYVHLDISSLH